MKLKIYSLFAFFLFFSFIKSQNAQEIPLPYNTSGYAEKSSGNLSTNKTVTDVLIPSVNAEMNVNEAGALTYTLPIEILKGLNNFQPNIALGYNSQSGNGQAGWGWNIMGLSTINRGGKSKEIDGVTMGPQFNNNDPFYLDGQRLIKVNETTFVTEKFSKVKITRPASGEFQFIIQYTDGRVAKYKELITGQYYISTFIDAFDNEIHYSYLVENRVPVITKISYGGANVAGDKFYINFIYKARKKNIQIFRNGNSFINTKVLEEINSGSTYTALYRKYNFTYDFVEDNSVERLRTVIVSNESNETLKPLNFNYNTSTQGTVKITSSGQAGFGYNLGSHNPAPVITGLGSVAIGDFLNNNVEKIQPVFQTRMSNGYGLKIGAGLTPTSINLLNNSSGNMFFSGKVLDGNSKITEKDQLINVYENIIGTGDFYNPNHPGNQQLKDEIIFDIKSLVTGTERKVSVVVKGGLIEVQNYIPPDPYDNYRDGTYETTYTRDYTRREYIQGDFNNDGLIDFLIIEPKNVNRPQRVYWAEVGKTDSVQPVQLNPVILNESSISLYNKDVYPIEFDGDGLPELLAVDKYNARFSVYKIDFTTNSLNTVVSNQALSNFGSDTPLFLGDFNGDGLTDFITPQKVYTIPEDDNSGLKMGDTYYNMQNETLLWWKYTSDGTTFVKNQEDYTQQKIAYVKPSQSNYIKKSTFWQKFWNGKPDEYAYTRYATNNIIITDFNNDGRSDIITLNKIGSAKYNTNGSLAGIPINNLPNIMFRRGPGVTILPFNSDLSNRVNFYENKNLQGGTFKQLTSYSIEGNKISPLSLIVSATNFDYLNVSKSGIYIYDPLVGLSTNITVDNSNFLEKQIQEVNNGSEVVQKIDYRNMIASPTPDEATYIYKTQDFFKYPYYVHKTNPILYLANKIHTIFDGKILTKEYRFENGIQHLEGKGFLGFQKTYSSDTYESELKNGRYVNKNPVKAVFWNIQTKDPTMDNAVIASTYGGINRYFTQASIANKKFDRGNHQYLILATNELTRDNLKQIYINKEYTYDESDDLKLKTAYTNYNTVGSSLSKYTYKPEFSNGDHYFYGKIASVEDATYKDGLSFTTKNESDYYPNGSTSEVRNFGNQANALPVITTYTYDAIGNTKTETLSTSGIISKTSSYDYDVTNRYVNKVTALNGLSSTSDINVLGRTLSEVSQLGLHTSYTFDSWGNISEVTDFLGKKTTISKSVADASTGGVYNVHKKREGGAETIVTFDRFDREIQTKTQTINNKWIVEKIEYDILGRKVKTSEPLFEGEPVKWNAVEYDELNRPVKNTSFTGKVITTCYEGMKITVDDGYKKTSKTLDAMGHVIRQQDHGGIIAFSYYPNGSTRETNYEGIKTSFEIDGWGNKTKIKDPSAGTFTYEYDNLSRITKEITPKGYTLFTYDDLGRPLTEKTYGNTPEENTNIEKTYSYNAQSKLLEMISGTSNGKNFTYGTVYDQYYRIIGKSEQTPDFVYSTTTSFDSYGRVDVSGIHTLLTGHLSGNSIKNVYDSNGILIQQNDNVTNKMVWHLSNANAKGQTTQMEYGNGYTLTNQYNPNDFSLFNSKHQNTTNGAIALDIDYNYDVNKGVLNWRRNNAFGQKEDFTYDKLNRLLSEAVNGVLANEYTYDKRGRITSNSELGKYNYNETDYKLQSINFNTNGQQINSNRGFASVTYNAFKSPINITLAGKDNLHFEYNILKTRYSMTSTSGKKTKFYSSDFAIEVTKNNETGEVQLITYINGSPYSANYIKKEVINSSGTVSNNYYLHRDNLGSILAITKTDGSVVEKRFFDAWGNLKGLVKSNGQTVTDAEQLRFMPLFLDRGYTGHEHLQTVGLINMNARIYDPVLRKFLSPDNLVADPYNTQSYDRFGYVYNNPLLYVDVDGNEAISLGVAVVIGVAVAIFSKAIINMISGIPFWYGMGKAAVVGAASAAISFGIGAAATSVFSEGLSVGKALFEAGMHAVSGGMMSVIDGGKFGVGALSGLVSSLIASGVQKIGTIGSFGSNNPDVLKAIMVTSGGLSGGISATIAGGNFWQGFRQGIITSGLNHALHMFTENGGDKTLADFKEKIEGEINDRMSEINVKIDKNNKTLSTSQKEGQIRRLTEANNDLTGQLAELIQAKSMLYFLLSKEHSFNIAVSENVPQPVRFHTMDGTVLWGSNDKSLVLAYNGTLRTLIHEMVHVYQIVKGTFEAAPFEAGQIVQLYDHNSSEVEAYRVQYSLSGYSQGVSKLSEINSRYIERWGK